MQNPSLPPYEHERKESNARVEALADTTGQSLSELPGISRRRLFINAATVMIAFGWGVSTGYWAWGRTAQVPVAASITEVPEVLLAAEPLTRGLPQSYTLPVAYGMLGPQLIRAGAFTFEAFVQVYAAAGQPLSEAQQAILREGSDQSIVFDPANAYFLLNLLWALGLSNNNRILREGALVADIGGQVERFASTGGWSLAVKPINQLYSGSALVSLTGAQQARVEEAAATIYRPCCNNPTSFPDCNHGMAMLGLLQLLAAEDADTDTLLEAAKMANRFWYPVQSRELAVYYQAQTGQGFAAVPPREAVGATRFSASGFGEVHNWLVANGKLETPTQNGSSCGV